MILPLILCVFSCALGIVLYKKIYNPCTVFFGLWTIFILLSSLGLYDCTIPTIDTYLILFIGLFGFLVGFVLASYNKTKSVYSRCKSNGIQYTLNMKVIVFLYTITSLYLLYQTGIVIKLLSTGSDLSVVRILYTSSEFNILRSSNVMVAIQNFIVTPTVYVVVALLPLEWFKGNRNKIFIISSIAMIGAWVLTTGGRSIIVWLAIYIAYLYIWSGKKLKLKKKTKRIVMILIVICFFALIYTTISRKGEDADFLFQIYQYFVVPIAHFEYRIQELNDFYPHIKGFGVASFYGILYPFLFVLNTLGWKYPTWLTLIRDLSFTNLEQVVTLGSVRMNAFVTTFFHFYLDGGIIGVFGGSVLFGYVAMWLYRKASNGTKTKYTLLYLLILQKLIFSFVRFYFTQPVQGISFLLALIVYKRVKISNNTDRQVPVMGKDERII
ncbi:O-antigen polymerase [Mediterraneibacter gnavus]|uniref:O-antigen polymerase n=1 Tax=Mediterraneibacter gnavus TaxID=33038 RepID=UPI0023306A4D|nr:O-antigen polymerase [Mediterraneibacter gnavus]MDB8711936.1 O-antigen ligase [Mediterraneibacter gnavus]MDB8714970.1 O-antigen ligase [Mediterraneibacter gnavus]